MHEIIAVGEMPGRRLVWSLITNSFYVLSVNSRYSPVASPRSQQLGVWLLGGVWIEQFGRVPCAIVRGGNWGPNHHPHNPGKHP